MPDTVKQSYLLEGLQNWTDQKIISEIVRLADRLPTNEDDYISSQYLQLKIFRLVRALLKNHSGMILQEAKRYMTKEESLKIPAEILYHLFEYGPKSWGALRRMVDINVDNVGGYLRKTVRNYLYRKYGSGKTKKEKKTIFASDLPSDSDGNCAGRDVVSIRCESGRVASPEYPEVDQSAVKITMAVGANIPIDNRYDAISPEVKEAIKDCNSGFKNGDVALEVFFLRADGLQWKEIYELPNVDAPSCEALRQRKSRMVDKLNEKYSELLQREFGSWDHLQ